MIAAVERLGRLLTDKAVISGETLRDQIAERISHGGGLATSAEELSALVSKGRKQFAEGDYRDAIETLERARAGLFSQAALLAKDQRLRKPLHHTLLTLAHVYWRMGRVDDALKEVMEAARTFPDRTVSYKTFGPEVTRLYKRGQKRLKRRGRGSIHIETTPPGCVVFVNERYVGLGPTTVKDLYTGEYRVHIQRYNQPGRVHVVSVGADERRQIAIDFKVDTILRSTKFAGFVFKTDGQRKRHQYTYAATVAGAIGVDHAILVEFDPGRGNSMIGHLVSAQTGAILRSATIPARPESVANETVTAFGRFLLIPEPGVFASFGPHEQESGVSKDALEQAQRFIAPAQVSQVAESHAR